LQPCRSSNTPDTYIKGPATRGVWDAGPRAASQVKGSSLDGAKRRLHSSSIPCLSGRASLSCPPLLGAFFLVRAPLTATLRQSIPPFAPHPTNTHPHYASQTQAQGRRRPRVSSSTHCPPAHLHIHIHILILHPASTSPPPPAQLPSQSAKAAPPRRRRAQRSARSHMSRVTARMTPPRPLPA
jgi:hypothetical protein